MASMNPQTPDEPVSLPPTQPAVRFASVNQEIEPANSLEAASSTASGVVEPNPEISQDDQEQLRSISRGLQNVHLQQSRMNNFAFEPVSLPVSRVPSNDSYQHQASREATRSGRNTPHISPSPSAAAGLGDLDLTKVHPEPSHVEPQVSPGSRKEGPSTASSNHPSRPSSASDQVSTRPTTHSQGSAGPESIPKVPRFSVDASGDSSIPSRGSSLTRTPAGGSGTATPPTSYSRPFTPVGDKDDPYARSKRPPQNKNPKSVDQRFVFDGIDSRRRSAYLPSTTLPAGGLPRSNSGTDLKSEHRQSVFPIHGIGGKSHGHDEGSTVPDKKHHGSMTDLKRFFGLGHHKKKGSQSPSTSAKGSVNQGGTRTPPHQIPAANVPFADDHGLESRYGKFGKVLGSGAGGSVRLIKRSSDGTTFAVKQFRERHIYETERDFAKKVTAEFCIGSTLHHGNVIETLDITYERGHWFEIMEYAPYDLFTIVMTGRMSREEITCSFLQIVNGVSFLHSMGLAHRDLKLDNVVVNNKGIMKLIDFGSATVFRYPFEHDINLASGIVGSDPYLAPEVYDLPKYDPQPSDIWSLAIIFACMTLRRFPWKAPRMTDGAFKLFASSPNAGTPSGRGSIHRSAEGRSQSEVFAASDVEAPRRASNPEAGKSTDNDDSRSTHSHHHRHHHHHEVQEQTSIDTPSTASPNSPFDRAGKEPIKGPWRLLRLLPRETRIIIQSMLDLDPKKRATLDDILKDHWVTHSPVCSQTEEGKVINVEGHRHTLEHSSTTSAAKP